MCLVWGTWEGCVSREEQVMAEKAVHQELEKEEVRIYRWGAKMDVPWPLRHIHLFLSSPQSLFCSLLNLGCTFPLRLLLLSYQSGRPSCYFLPTGLFIQPGPHLPKTSQKPQSWATFSPSLKRLGLMGRKWIVKPSLLEQLPGRWYLL